MSLELFRSMKKHGKKITILTCYDATFAGLLESISIDALLVGDSLGMVIKGQRDTRNVSLADIVYHTQAVSYGAKSTFIISDLPINTYETNELAYKSASALMEAGANMIKIEGSSSLASRIEYLNKKNIKVCGHIGLMPQSIKDINPSNIKTALEKSIKTINEDAEILEKAGADMLVLSSVPDEIAKVITKKISIPTIGFRSGKNCDGKVFILYDLLMLSDSSNDLYANEEALWNQKNIVRNLLLEFIKTQI